MSTRTDRSRSASQRAASVRVVGPVPRHLLLPVRFGDGREPGAHAAVGRVAPGASGLRQPQADGKLAPRRFGHQSQAGGPVAASEGDRGDLRQAQDESAGAGAPDLSVSVAGGWRPDAGWAGGLMATIRNVRTRRWVMRRRQKCTLILAPTAPSPPVGKPCGRQDQSRTERLESRPPAAVRIGTQSKGRGRTGSARHSSFSLFQMV
jgi:hypothetical protein